MALYGSRRDINLFKSLNRELLHNIIEQQIGYYKFQLDNTKVNLYGESLEKSLSGPVLITCLIKRGDANWDTSDKNSPDVKKTSQFKFLRDDLAEANIFPEVGDVILWNEMYFEVDSVNENQLIVGKDPDYSYSTSVQNHGSSLSIILDTHYTNPERWGIKKERG